MASTTFADIVVSQEFSDWSLLATKQTSALVQSGAMMESPELAEFLRNTGSTLVERFINDLTGAENVGTDTSATATPDAYTGGGQTIHRLQRNKGFGTYGVVVSQEGDPARYHADRIGAYWARRMQYIALSMLQGVFADNDAAPSGTEHVQGDMTLDISGASYSAGVTDFSYAALIDAKALMGDASDDISVVVMDSVHYAAAQKANLVQELRPNDAPSSMERFFIGGPRIVVWDGIPSAGGVHSMYLLGAGALRYGLVDADVGAYTTEFVNATGNGQGEEQIWSRKQIAIAPVGSSCIASQSAGGPSNTTLESASSWERVVPERKQQPMVRLITREA